MTDPAAGAAAEATTAEAAVAAAAAAARTVAELDLAIAECFACPRLVAWRSEVAVRRRAAFRDQTYWGRAVPGFGPADAAVLVVGLAPAAHGANRTGRLFTGDRSGEVLFAALHRMGFASQPLSTAAGDGMRLAGLRITAPVHCAPPANMPTPDERRTCGHYLRRELDLLAGTLRVIVVLGGFGWRALLTQLIEIGWVVASPRPDFGHGALAVIHHPDGRSLTVLGCYHVSQQNTFTGRLTPAMLDQVLAAARAIADYPAGRPPVPPAGPDRPARPPRTSGSERVRKPPR